MHQLQVGDICDMGMTKININKTLNNYAYNYNCVWITTVHTAGLHILQRSELN